MNSTIAVCVRISLLAGTVFGSALSLGGARSASESVLYSFTGGIDGSEPYGGVILDRRGRLVGTTTFGGVRGWGTLFKLTPGGSETVLVSFDTHRGREPYGDLIADSQGNLFGTTSTGGKHDGTERGTVFRLAPDGRETVVHAFENDGHDGAFPTAGLIAGGNGNFYGTTTEGGGELDGGIVFELAPDGTETVLHDFLGGTDGAYPWGSLLEDKLGNLYGMTTAGGGGGNNNCGGWSSIGCGTVFKLAPNGTETLLYVFQGGSDGGDSESNLIADASGNLYGTSPVGGVGSCLNGWGCGTLFKLTPGGTKTVLYAFQGGGDGGNPDGNLIVDPEGNFYGVTYAGGGTGCGGLGCGTVFEISPEGSEKLLYAFLGGSDGASPFAGVIADKKGHLYGTTLAGGGDGCGGRGCGTVFELKR